MNKKYVVANWKMFGDVSFFDEVQKMDDHLKNPINTDVAYCVPSILLARLADKQFQNITVGGQDCHHQPSGAFTGDISAGMLIDAGAKTVILGHSERRMYHKETSPLVAEKVKQAHAHGLNVIVCVGESQIQREAGQVVEVIHRKLRDSLPDTVTPQNTIVSYEPIWAIGTGLIPSPEEIYEVHKHIHDYTAKKFGHSLSILYGGSVKASNAAEIAKIQYVDGALVGGASLKFDDFYPIVKAFSEV